MQAKPSAQAVLRPITARQTHPIRHEVLRPGQPISACNYPGDDDAETVHFGAFVGDEVVGVASLYREAPPGAVDKNAWRIRGMATAPAQRGQGWGGALLQACIDHVATRGGGQLWCNARTPAVSFYSRYGFETQGDEFELPGIGPHYLMIRRAPGRQSSIR